MYQVKLGTEHAVSEPTFWEIFFDESFNTGLYDHLDFKKRELLELSRDNGRVKRAVRMTPRPPDTVPMALRSFMGDGIVYDETGVFDPSDRHYRIEIEPNRLKGRIEIRGHIWVDSLGDDRCRRNVNLNIKVSVPMVGGTIEKRIGTDIEESYGRAAGFFDDYAARR